MIPLKQVIATKNAPAAIGPYSQATKHNGFIFVSGQLPLVPETGEFVAGGIGEMTTQCMNNIKAIVEAAGSSMDKMLKMTILLADMGDFAAVNAAYGAFFNENPPARAAYQVAVLPKNARVEIEAICAE